MDELERSDFYLMPDSERATALEANCDEVKQNYVYSKQLSEFEIAAKNSLINQALQEIERLKEERKDLNALIKAELEIVSLNNVDVINKFVKVTENCYLVNDFVTGYACVINPEGLIIEKTRLKRGAQMNIFNQQKEAI